MSFDNGRLPAYMLATIPGGRLRRGNPARSWLAMRYYIARKTGGAVWLYPTGPMSSYRTYEQQVVLWNRYQAGGALAARPGYSNHGSAVRAACDVPTPAMQAAVRKWGHRFGWGIAGGKLPSDAPSEPWHCTFAQDRLTPWARVWFWRYRRAEKRKK